MKQQNNIDQGGKKKTPHLLTGDRT